MATARIVHDLFVLLLRVIASASTIHLSPRADLGQFGPGLDFNAPALVICEVQVQAVHLVVCDQVNVSLYVLDAEEVSRHIEHGTAPPEAGSIAYRNGGQADASRAVRGQELPKSLDAVKQSRWTICA